MYHGMPMVVMGTSQSFADGPGSGPCHGMPMVGNHKWKRSLPKYISAVRRSAPSSLTKIVGAPKAPCASFVRSFVRYNRTKLQTEQSKTMRTMHAKETSIIIPITIYLCIVSEPSATLPATSYQLPATSYQLHLNNKQQTNRWRANIHTREMASFVVSFKAVLIDSLLASAMALLTTASERSRVFMILRMFSSSEMSTP
jgi:hypothetical protein